MTGTAVATDRAFERLDEAARNTLREVVEERYREAAAQGLALDMTRGKPSPEQLDLSRGLLESVDSDSFRAADGTDCRNYGNVDGLAETRALFAEYLGVAPETVVIGGNSSLELEHDMLVQALLVGVPGGRGPWSREPVTRFLCPCPGYDRHFAILERYGIEMIPVPLTGEGPAMDEVERLVGEDPAIRGMFCVPRYSNPTGETYSARTVERLAAMRAQAPDFRIFWDDAYAVHHLGRGRDELPDVLELAARSGNPDRFVIFGSTSKITHGGGGIGVVATSPANRAHLVAARSIQTIGPDKLNQLRHVRFLGGRDGIEALMDRHAAILAPKFDAVDAVLEERLGRLEVARWSKPRGGYFISIDTRPGCARRVVELAAEAGVKLTPAGATFPHGRDPEDRNLRVAPSLPPIDELRRATELLADCIVLATLESVAS